MTPRWISAWARGRRVLILALVALTTAYWWGDVPKALDFPAAVAEIKHFGLEPAVLLAVVVILLEIGGSVLVIVGRLVWLGAGALAVFTVAATVVGHAFWMAPPAVRFQEINSFLEHIGLIGGFLLAIAQTERETSRQLLKDTL